MILKEKVMKNNFFTTLVCPVLLPVLIVLATYIEFSTVI